MTVAISLATTTDDVIGVTCSGLPPVVNVIDRDHTDGHAYEWAGSGSFTIVPTGGYGLIAYTSTDGAYLTLSLTSVPSGTARIRVKVRSDRHEGPPIGVALTDSSGGSGTLTYIGGGVEQLELELVSSSTMSARLYAYIPAGESSIQLVILETVVDVIPTGSTWSLDRWDDNGVRPVRLNGVEPDSSGDLFVEDRECALTGSCTYDLQSSYGDADDTAAATSQPGAAIHVLDGSAPVENVLLAAGLSRDPGVILHDVIGAEFPLVDEAPMRSRNGSLTLLCSTISEALYLEALFAQGRTMMLRTPDYTGRDLYFVATGVDVAAAANLATPAASRRWQVTVRVREVDPS